jgi:hypothetical protein
MGGEEMVTTPASLIGLARQDNVKKLGDFRRQRPSRQRTIQTAGNNGLGLVFWFWSLGIYRRSSREISPRRVWRTHRGFNPRVSTLIIIHNLSPGAVTSPAPLLIVWKASLGGANKYRLSACATLSRCQVGGGYAEALAGKFPYLARQSGEQK